MSLSEHESHWKTFLKGLEDRGMSGVKLVISDDHEGLGAARRMVLFSSNDAIFTFTEMLVLTCPDNP